jgi:hypothetical protein
MKTYTPRRKLDVFLTGLGKVLDLGGVISIFQPCLTGRKKVRGSFPFFRSDVDAFRSDWFAVGMDLNHAVQTYTSRHAEK